MWIRRKVKSGQKLGRKLGHPTLNFHIGTFKDHYKPAVYSAEVKINEKLYRGALYFGPKGTGRNTLEIYVLDFSKNVYGKFVKFKVGKKIRGPMKFESLEELKKQIRKDLQSVV